MRSPLSVHRPHTTQQVVNWRKGRGRAAKNAIRRMHEWLKSAVLIDPIAEKRREVLQHLDVFQVETTSHEVSEEEKSRRAAELKRQKQERDAKERARKEAQKKASEEKARLREEEETKRKAAEEEEHRQWQEQVKKQEAEAKKQKEEEDRLKKEKKAQATQEEKTKQEKSKKDKQAKSKKMSESEKAVPVEEPVPVVLTQRNEAVAPVSTTKKHSESESAVVVQDIPLQAAAPEESKSSKKNKKNKKVSESELVAEVQKETVAETAPAAPVADVPVAAPVEEHADKKSKKNKKDKKHSESEVVAQVQETAAEIAAPPAPVQETPAAIHAEEHHAKKSKKNKKDKKHSESEKVVEIKQEAAEEVIPAPVEAAPVEAPSAVEDIPLPLSTEEKSDKKSKKNKKDKKHSESEMVVEVKQEAPAEVAPAPFEETAAPAPVVEKADKKSKKNKKDKKHSESEATHKEETKVVEVEEPCIAIVLPKVHAEETSEPATTETAAKEESAAYTEKSDKKKKNKNKKHQEEKGNGHVPNGTPVPHVKENGSAVQETTTVTAVVQTPAPTQNDSLDFLDFVTPKVAKEEAPAQSAPTSQPAADDSLDFLDFVTPKANRDEEAPIAPAPTPVNSEPQQPAADDSLDFLDFVTPKAEKKEAAVEPENNAEATTAATEIKQISLEDNPIVSKETSVCSVQRAENLVQNIDGEPVVENLDIHDEHKKEASTTDEQSAESLVDPVLQTLTPAAENSSEPQILENENGPADAHVVVEAVEETMAPLKNIENQQESEIANASTLEYHGEPPIAATEPVAKISVEDIPTKESEATSEEHHSSPTTILDHADGAAETLTPTSLTAAEPSTDLYPIHENQTVDTVQELVPAMETAGQLAPSEGPAFVDRVDADISAATACETPMANVAEEAVLSLQPDSNLSQENEQSYATKILSELAVREVCENHENVAPTSSEQKEDASVTSPPVDQRVVENVQISELVESTVLVDAPNAPDSEHDECKAVECAPSDECETNEAISCALVMVKSEETNDTETLPKVVSTTECSTIPESMTAEAVASETVVCQDQIENVSISECKEDETSSNVESGTNCIEAITDAEEPVENPTVAHENHNTNEIVADLEEVPTSGVSRGEQEPEAATSGPAVPVDILSEGLVSASRHNDSQQEETNVLSAETAAHSQVKEGRPVDECSATEALTEETSSREDLEAAVIIPLEGPTGDAIKANAVDAIPQSAEEQIVEERLYHENVEERAADRLQAAEPIQELTEYHSTKVVSEVVDCGAVAESTASEANVPHDAVNVEPNQSECVHEPTLTNVEESVDETDSIQRTVHDAQTVETESTAHEQEIPPAQNFAIIFTESEANEVIDVATVCETETAVANTQHENPTVPSDQAPQHEKIHESVSEVTEPENVCEETVAALASAKEISCVNGLAEVCETVDEEQFFDAAVDVPVESQETKSSIEHRSRSGTPLEPVFVQQISMTVESPPPEVVRKTPEPSHEFEIVREIVETVIGNENDHQKLKETDQNTVYYGDVMENLPSSKVIQAVESVLQKECCGPVENNAAGDFVESAAEVLPLGDEALTVSAVQAVEPSCEARVCEEIESDKMTVAPDQKSTKSDNVPNECEKSKTDPEEKLISEVPTDETSVSEGKVEVVCDISSESQINEDVKDSSVCETETTMVPKASAATDDNEKTNNVRCEDTVSIDVTEVTISQPAVDGSSEENKGLTPSSEVLQEENDNAEDVPEIQSPVAADTEATLPADPSSDEAQCLIAVEHKSADLEEQSFDNAVAPEVPTEETQPEAFSETPEPAIIASSYSTIEQHQDISVTSDYVHSSGNDQEHIETSATSESVAEPTEEVQTAVSPASDILTEELPVCVTPAENVAFESVPPASEASQEECSNSHKEAVDMFHSEEFHTAEDSKEIADVAESHATVQEVSREESQISQAHQELELEERAAGDNHDISALEEHHNDVTDDAAAADISFPREVIEFATPVQEATASESNAAEITAAEVMPVSTEEPQSCEVSEEPTENAHESQEGNETVAAESADQSASSQITSEEVEERAHYKDSHPEHACLTAALEEAVCTNEIPDNVHEVEDPAPLTESPMDPSTDPEGSKVMEENAHSEAISDAFVESTPAPVGELLTSTTESQQLETFATTATDEFPEEKTGSEAETEDIVKAAPVSDPLTGAATEMPHSEEPSIAQVKVSNEVPTVFVVSEIAESSIKSETLVSAPSENLCEPEETNKGVEVERQNESHSEFVISEQGSETVAQEHDTIVTVVVTEAPASADAPAEQSVESSIAPVAPESTPVISAELNEKNSVEESFTKVHTEVVNAAPVNDVVQKEEADSTAGKKNKKNKNKKNRNSKSITEQTEISVAELDKHADAEIAALNAGSASPPIQVNEISSTEHVENGHKETIETIVSQHLINEKDVSPTRFAQNVQALVEKTLQQSHPGVEIDPSVKMQIDIQLKRLAERRPVVEARNVITPLPLQLHVSRPTTPVNRERLYKLLPKDIIFCSGLIDAHGEDYNAMAADPRNIYRENARGLQRKIRIFKESPHFQSYLKAKEEGVTVESILATEAH